MKATRWRRLEGMLVKKDVREISALLESMDMGVYGFDIMDSFFREVVRAFASLFGLVRGGALDLRCGWNSSDELAQRTCLLMESDTHPVRVGLAEMCSFLPVAEPMQGMYQ